jgi:hypothetical protein
LCYKPCNSTYNGVGPVCWGQCGGDYPTPCGAGCAVSSEACTKAIINQVSSVAEFSYNIGMLASSAGGAPIGQLFKAGIDEVALKAAKAQIKKTLKEIGEDLAETTLINIAENVGNAARDGEAFDWTTIDPLGVGVLVQAYKNPIC